MTSRRIRSVAQRALAVVLTSLVSVLPLMAGEPEPGPAPSERPVGQISAVIPAAQRNEKIVKVKDEVDWNDVLRTDRTGRARLNLRDGSILSLGSYSELKVVAHDPAAQLTLLQLNFGKVRSRVVAINQPDGRFELRTPLAVINVLGTDFYTQFDAPSNTFRLICYSGSVKISGLGKFAGRSETIHAGQMLEISSSSFGSPLATLNAVQQDSIAETTTEGAGTMNADSHLLRNLLIGAAAAAAGVVVGLVSSGTFTSGQSTSSSGQRKPPQQ